MLRSRVYFAWEKGCDYMAAQCNNNSLNVYLKEGFDECCQLLAFNKQNF